MKYYLQFTKNGAYLHGDAPNQKRCNLATSADGKTFVATAGFRSSLHTTEAESEAEAVAALGLVPYVVPTRTARQILAEAECTGIDVTVGGTTYRLRCKESDRAAFAQLATLILTAQSVMTSAQKTAHRATTTVIVDAAGSAHVITIGAFQELVVAYGLAYNALWAAAAAS